MKNTFSKILLIVYTPLLVLHDKLGGMGVGMGVGGEALAAGAGSSRVQLVSVHPPS